MWVLTLTSRIMSKKFNLKFFANIRSYLCDRLLILINTICLYDRLLILGLRQGLDCKRCKAVGLEINGRKSAMR